MSTYREGSLQDPFCDHCGAERHNHLGHELSCPPKNMPSRDIRDAAVKYLANRRPAYQTPQFQAGYSYAIDLLLGGIR